MKSGWGGARKLSDLAAPADEPDTLPGGRDDAHDAQPCFALRLVAESGDEWSVMYGSLVGSPAWNPSHGIAFVFEALHPSGWGRWEAGRWLVTIRGSNLGRIYHHLCQSRQRFIRVGANADDGPGDAPEVTAISVEKLPAK